MSTWKDQARGVVTRLARTHPSFSANDVWNSGLPQIQNRRNLSGVLLSMERQGIIRRTGRQVRSIGGHGQPILEWRGA